MMTREKGKIGQLMYLFLSVFPRMHARSVCPPLCNPMDCSPPGFSVHGFSRQEYWSGLPLPSPGDLPNPGIKPESPTLTGGFFTTEPPGKSHFPIYTAKNSMGNSCVYHYDRNLSS